MRRLSGIFRPAFKVMGKNFQHSRHNVYLSPEMMSFGDDVFVGPEAHFSGKITVGDRVMFGPRNMVLAGSHTFGRFGERTRFSSGTQGFGVRIEDDVWCGASVIILDGSVIGTGAVIGAGSVVRFTSIPPYVVAAGNPAVVVSKIFPDPVLRLHLEKTGYKNPDEIVERRKEATKHLHIPVTCCP